MWSPPCGPVPILASSCAGSRTSAGRSLSKSVARPRRYCAASVIHVKLAAPEPEVLRVIGEESERKGTSTLTARQIEQ
jgi:hypothetical protein